MTDCSIPFNPNTPCDNCGTMGAFDFMGDCLCMKCGLGECKQGLSQDKLVELLSQVLTHLERIENLMKWPQSEVRWIHIAESVPPEHMTVLLRGWPVTRPNHSVIVGYREGNKYRRVLSMSEWELEPRYWMHILPLPEEDWRK